MPFHRIYAPPLLFTPEEKQSLATAVTSIYRRLPPFYVIINFIDVHEDSFFIGGEQWSKRKQSTGKPFVRILIQHLAVHQETAEARSATLKRIEGGYRPILEAKGFDWELTIEEPPADYWSMSGHVPPLPTDTDAKDMQAWREADRPLTRSSSS